MGHHTQQLGMWGCVLTEVHRMLFDTGNDLTAPQLDRRRAKAIDEETELSTGNIWWAPVTVRRIRLSSSCQFGSMITRPVALDLAVTHFCLPGFGAAIWAGTNLWQMHVFHETIYGFSGIGTVLRLRFGRRMIGETVLSSSSTQSLSGKKLWHVFRRNRSLGWLALIIFQRLWMWLIQLDIQVRQHR